MQLSISFCGYSVGESCYGSDDGCAERSDRCSASEEILNPLLNVLVFRAQAEMAASDGRIGQIIICGQVSPAANALFVREYESRNASCSNECFATIRDRSFKFHSHLIGITRFGYAFEKIWVALKVDQDAGFESLAI